MSFCVAFSRIVVAKPFWFLRFAFGVHMSLRVDTGLRDYTMMAQGKTKIRTSTLSYSTFTDDEFEISSTGCQNFVSTTPSCQL